jgi:signal transduction histidine kinase/ActR/RegA family two-component response regulator
VSGVARQRDDRILVLAPTGRDAELTGAMLTQAGLCAEMCPHIEDLAAKVDAGAGAAVIAEEALAPAAVLSLVDVLRRQPTWSDLPLIVITSGGDATESSMSALKVVEAMGNVTLLERPVRVVTLLSAVHSALRARRRQYEVRDHLEERKRAEAERELLLARERAARAEVEEANRAKDEFLAVLSHELRTPLQPILGWVKLMRNRVDPETLERGLATIERNARTQAQIVEDLLDISRVIVGKLRLDRRPVSVAPVIESAVEAVRAAADAKAIRIETTCPPRPAIVSGDPHRLQQVVWNLLSNAVAFTPERGRVTVTLDRTEREAVVTVSDTGQGIAPEFLAQIFDRFRQADSTSTRRHGGLGLGLAIVRHLVEMHAGSVAAHSDGAGKGATFTVRLPLIAEDAEVASAAVSGGFRTGHATDAPPLGGLHVLVVDDDTDTCELLTAVLGYYGARVTAASSAEDALRALDRGLPDVVVSDVAMPGTDGYAFVRRLKAIERERGSRIPAMALTAHARASDSEQAFLAGFEAYVAKPVEPAELAQCIAKLAGKSAAA